MQSVIIRTFHGETFYWERICISTCSYRRSNKRVVFSVTCQNKKKDHTAVGYTQVPHHTHLFLFHLFMFNCQDRVVFIWVCSSRPVKTVSSVCFHLVMTQAFCLDFLYNNWRYKCKLGSPVQRSKIHITPQSIKALFALQCDSNC